MRKLFGCGQRDFGADRKRKQEKCPTGQRDTRKQRQSQFLRFQGREDEKCRQENEGENGRAGSGFGGLCAKEDKTIRPFAIPSQPEIVGNVLKISEYTTLKKHPDAKSGQVNR